MNHRLNPLTVAFAAVYGCLPAVLLTGCSSGEPPPVQAVISGQPEPASPQQVRRNAYFGDLHLHTAMSFDAAAAGTRVMPDDAYRFAMGETVSYFGREIRRRAALDFLAVTDHAEYLGVAISAADPRGPFAGTQWPGKIAATAGEMLPYLRIFSPAGFRGESPVPEFVTAEIISSNWQFVINSAQKFYRPGKFTTLVAYEWSPMPGGFHLHRNVIFRGPDYPDRPFSAIDSMKPEDLWSYAENNRKHGIDSVLIPHNSNLSGGLMFAGVDSAGAELTAAYANRRVENERLVEITQIKGTSETRPRFSPEDEFADFELVAFGQGSETDPAGGYIRPALRRGLEIAVATGVNPFEFGFAGGSDFHSGISASEESNYPGGLGSGDEQSEPRRVLTSTNPLMQTPTTVFSAGGLTGVWAGENTREAIFDALQRREVFATSGPRIQLRLFAGWNFPADLMQSRDWPVLAYEAGSPMGSSLSRPGSNANLQLLVHALKDPDGANLDRIQVIKTWMSEGKTFEQVIDVAWSGDRAIDPESGNLTEVGNTVDLARASYTNTIGARELKQLWTDPGFDPEVPAIYYIRVLEIPTPRWSTYLAARNELPLSPDVPASIQERAWSSPVYYRPSR